MISLSYLHKNNEERTDGGLPKCLLCSEVDVIHHYVWPLIEASKQYKLSRQKVVREYYIGVKIIELE